VRDEGRSERVGCDVVFGITTALAMVIRVAALMYLRGARGVMSKMRQRKGGSCGKEAPRAPWSALVNAKYQSK
jgi:hypothetical protein